MLTKPQAIKLILGLIIAIIGIMGITPKAYAADVVLASGSAPLFEKQGVIWTGVNTGYFFGQTGSFEDKEMWWSKTTNGGLTFSAPTVFDDVGTLGRWCGHDGEAFYDDWTPGVTDEYIHLYYFRNSGAATCSSGGTDRRIYRRFDTATDSFDVNELVSVTSCGGTTTCVDEFQTISRAANGYLYRYSAPNANPTEHFGTSTDDGATWSSVALPSCDLAYLMAVQTSTIFLVESEDIFGYCPSNTTIQGYDRSANSWVERYDYVPDHVGVGETVCEWERILDGDTGQFFLLINGGDNTGCTTGNNWLDIITNSPTNSAVFNVRNVFNGLTAPQGRFADGLFSATEDFLYVFDKQDNGLDDDIVFYVSEDRGVTWSDATVFDSEEQSRTFIYLTEAVTSHGGWIYPIWFNATDGTYDTNLLAIFAQLPIFDFPGENPPEEILQGFSEFLGTWLFVAVVAGSIFFMHIIWRWPYELMYPIGLICGAILGHPTVAIIESWWIIAAVALIAAIYIYRLILAPDTASDGG